MECLVLRGVRKTVGIMRFHVFGGGGGVMEGDDSGSGRELKTTNGGSRCALDSISLKFTERNGRSKGLSSNKREKREGKGTASFSARWKIRRPERRSKTSESLTLHVGQELFTSQMKDN